MSESVLVALVSGVLTFLGVVVTNLSNGRKMEAKLATAQAVTDTKIQELTREVRDHNNFARRMPVVEEKIENLTDRLKELEKGA